MTEFSSAELKGIVREAVREELEASGLRVSNADNQDAARADFRFLRRLRESVEGASSKIGGTILVAIISGVLWLVWLGFQAVTGK